MKLLGAGLQGSSARLRDVDAIGLGFEIVARDGVGPGAAAAADAAIFTDAAAALKSVGIAQGQKYRMGLIDLDDRILRKTSAAQRQESGRSICCMRYRFRVGHWS
jgi:hypothetical protein